VTFWITHFSRDGKRFRESAGWLDSGGRGFTGPSINHFTEIDSSDKTKTMPAIGRRVIQEIP